MSREHVEPAVERVPCPVCGGQDGRALFVARDRLLGRPGSFPVMRCDGCGFVFLNPRPTADALAAYYPASYYPLDAEPAPDALAVARGLCERVAVWVAETGDNAPSVLDIGCGTGLFLQEGRAVGWQVCGIEPSAAAVAYARNRFGLPVCQVSLAASALPDDTFDVVTMWHVLEHLPDPVAAVRQVARSLRPGGLLLLAVPNFASVESRLFGRRWYSLDAPRHLSHFTPGTLSAVLELGGLRPERIVHSDSPAGLTYSLMGDLTGLSLTLHHRPLSPTAYHHTAQALSGLMAPASRLAALTRHGGALEVYATRPR